MRENPCRYCINGMTFKGKAVPGECGTCDNYKKHMEYLISQRKFEPGERIFSLDELVNQRFVFIGNSEKSHPKHSGFVQSMQLRTVNDYIQRGMIYKAIYKGGTQYE